MKVMPTVEVVIVSICVAAAGCVKFSEVLVSLVSFTINTESVLNLRTGDRAVVYCTPCVMSVVLFSVRVATSKSCMCMVTTAIHLHPSAVDTSAVVSARGVCSVPYFYKFFLQVDALPVADPGFSKGGHRNDIICMTSQVNINDVTDTMRKAISRSCEIDCCRNFLWAMKN